MWFFDELKKFVLKDTGDLEMKFSQPKMFAILSLPNKDNMKVLYLLLYTYHRNTCLLVLSWAVTYSLSVFLDLVNNNDQKERIK